MKLCEISVILAICVALIGCVSGRTHRPSAVAQHDDRPSYQALYRTGRFVEAARVLQESVGDRRTLSDQEFHYAELIYRATHDGELIAWLRDSDARALHRAIDEYRRRGNFVWEPGETARPEKGIHAFYIMPPMTKPMTYMSWAFMAARVNGKRNYALVDTGARSSLIIPDMDRVDLKTITEKGASVIGERVEATLDLELPIGIMRNVAISEVDFEPVASVDNNLIVGLPVLLKFDVLEFAFKEDLIFLGVRRPIDEGSISHSVKLYFNDSHDERRGLLYADLDVSGRRMRAVIDTGSGSILTLPESSYCLSVGIENKNLTQSKVGGVRVVPVTSCDAIISLGEHDVQVRADSVDYDEIEQELMEGDMFRVFAKHGDAVLGLGFFTKFERVILDFENMTLTFVEP